ncbi:siphovirus ReqiPepy6 Gp37-like family protein [Lachnospiraceae bacterium LCP25S3_G4]
MELKTLDKDFIPVGDVALKYLNLQWNRKYYEYGDFQIQILSKDYDPNMKYVYAVDRKEIGILNQPKLEESINGDFIVLTGFLYNKILDDKIVYPTFYANGNITTEVRRQVSTYKEDIPNLYLKESQKTLGTKILWQDTGTELGKSITDVLKTQELAYRINYSYVDNKFYFEIYQGLNRTQSQTENNFVVFSHGFKNLKNVKVEIDDSNYKNYFVVGGSGEASDRIIEIVDLSNGGYKKKKFIDAKGESYDETKQTLAEYKQTLRQKGLEEALKYLKVYNFEFDALQSGSVYLEDYDIGDKCDIVIESMKLSYEARLIEVNEVYENGNKEIKLIFGDKKPTIYEKVRIK